MYIKRCPFARKKGIESVLNWYLNNFVSSPTRLTHQQQTKYSNLLVDGKRDIWGRVTASCIWFLWGLFLVKQNYFQLLNKYEYSIYNNLPVHICCAININPNIYVCLSECGYVYSNIHSHQDIMQARIGELYCWTWTMEIVNE